jgi:VIT1/CCC1 family predicted Fe2+/Mn2+ transporter
MKFSHSLKTGLSFGLTSATITTLGLMVGLESGTKSKLIVMGGILTIAIADAFSDALGIHVSEESEGKHSSREIWMATLSTFAAKFFFAMTFIIPVVFLELTSAVLVGIAWGLVIMTLASYQLAKSQKQKPLGVIMEHVGIMFIVIVITHYVGDFVSMLFA